MSQTVRTSTRLWSQEVAEVEALTAMDSAGPGADGLAKLLERKEPGYDWSNGRKFVSKTDPYA
jgi:hypothetical protein